MKSPESTVEDLLRQIGENGRYQTGQHALHFFAAFLSGMHMFSLIFIAATPTHRCFIPELDVNISSPTFDKGILSSYIPEADWCRRFSEPVADRSVDKTLESCNGHFVYDTSIYQQSRVVDWDMVCENGKWKRALIQSIYVFGVFIGALFCGSLADRYGRKAVLVVSGMMQFIFAISQPYFTNFGLYCSSLFFYGMFGSAGAYVTAYVLCMELVHTKNRATVGAIFNSSFAVGACFVAIYGYFIRDIWLLQTVFGLHSLVLFSYWWLLDESIRWLWSQGRNQDAVKLAKKATRMNCLPFKNDFVFPSSNNSSSTKTQNYGIRDLLRFPIMRKRAAIVAFNWFATSLCFYGLAFNTGRLEGNPYLVFFISAAADLPGFIFVALTVNKTGRRSLNATLLFVGGLCCIITTIIPRGLLVTVLAMAAKIALAACFTIIYNYTCELFPTVVRNSALGLCTMSSRLGGMLTPQITLLNTLDPSIPPFVFGGVALAASLAGLFLPETLNKELPQTLDDGESYGKGDNAFTSCYRKNKESGVNDKMLVA